MQYKVVNPHDLFFLHVIFLCDEDYAFQNSHISFLTFSVAF